MGKGGSVFGYEVSGYHLVIGEVHLLFIRDVMLFIYLVSFYRS